MVRTKDTYGNLVDNYVIKYKNEFYKCALGKLWCRLCSKEVKCSRKSIVDNHRVSKTHILNLEKIHQLPDISIILSKSHFLKDISQLFLKTNIPFAKLRSDDFKTFFSKYNLPIPTETTARRHLEEITEDINNSLVLNFKDNPIFCIADSSTINNSHYTICLIGKVDTPNKTYLATLDINKTPVDSAYISRTIDEALKKFEIKRENFYLLISDAARYMEKAASLLKNFYPGLINITCLSHLLHNVCLKIKNHFKNVDNLIGYTKALIQKNSTRRALFCDIGQPPTPIVTRWGSWLNAANYYIQHYEEVKEIVMGLRESGSIVQKAQQCFIEDTLNKEELREIHTCYSFLVEIIDNFTKKKYNIEMGYEMIKDLKFGDDPVNIKQYIDRRLDRNQISEICDLSSNIEIFAREGLLKCQSTSVDVE